MVFTMVRELPRMVPHGHSAINRARAMFTCGPSDKFERIRHEGRRRQRRRTG